MQKIGYNNVISYSQKEMNKEAFVPWQNLWKMFCDFQADSIKK